MDPASQLETQRAEDPSWNKSQEITAERRRLATASGETEAAHRQRMFNAARPFTGETEDEYRHRLYNTPVGELQEMLVAVAFPPPLRDLR